METDRHDVEMKKDWQKKTLDKHEGTINQKA